MKHKFQTENTCAKLIEFELIGDKVHNVEFLGGGCPGNLQALPRLVEGMSVNEIDEKLGNIVCGRRGTSCAAQLAKGVKEAYQKSKHTV